MREYIPLPDRGKNNPLKHFCLEACNFCLRRWATFDHIKSLPKRALPDHIHIIDVFFVHVYTVFFDIFIYVMCMYLIYIYTLKYVHQHLGLDFHILGSKKWFIPHYIIMGSQIGIEIRGTRLPTPKRFPWTSAACAAALPKAWTNAETSEVGARMGVIAVVQDVIGFIGIWLVVSNIFYFRPEPWGNDPIWLIFFKLVETSNQVFCVVFCWNCVRNGNFFWRSSQGLL